MTSRVRVGQRLSSLLAVAALVLGGIGVTCLFLVVTVWSWHRLTRHRPARRHPARRLIAGAGGDHRRTHLFAGVWGRRRVTRGARPSAGPAPPRPP